MEGPNNNLPKPQVFIETGTNDPVYNQKMKNDVDRIMDTMKTHSTFKPNGGNSNNGK